MIKFSGKEKNQKSRIRIIIKFSLILILAFVVSFSSYIIFQLVKQHFWVNEVQNTVDELTPDQKETDFKYLTQVVHDYYLFAEENKQIKGLENLKDLDDMYIERARATKNNKEFMELFCEYLERIHQTGHAYLISPNEAKGLNTFASRALLDIKKENFNKTEYWYSLKKEILNTTSSDLIVFYQDGCYYLAQNVYASNKLIPKDAQIVKINGLDIDEYVKTLQDKHWLRYDNKNKKIFIADPFMVASNDGKEYWNVDFKFQNGEITTSKIMKKNNPIIDPRFDNNPFNQTFCLELNNEVGYIRASSFLGDYTMQNAQIQDFMKNSNNKYKKLIIDIRGNDGGNPEYWMKVFVEPLIKNTNYYQRKAAVSKKLLNKLGIEFSVYKALGEGLFNKDNLNFYDAKEIENSNEGNLQNYEVSRVFEPKNSFPFDGQVYLIVDNECFSAAEDFVGAVKEMKLARIVGTNTQGGAATFIQPVPYCLPESGIMFMMESELTYNSDGSINEIYGTKPDVELETSKYPTPYPLSKEKDALVEDPWIKWVIEE